MPLRKIVALEGSETVAVLDCGHRKALLVWLHVGDTMRCRDCYVAGMRRAAYLIDGVDNVDD